MKRFIFTLVAVVLGITSASALSPTYKGFGETYSGWGVPVGDGFGAGVVYGLSTSHGVTLIPGLFVGGGVDFTLGYYSVPENRYRTDTECSGFFAVFTEGRYNILRTKRISPFVSTRIGGGYNGMCESGSFYFRPAAGCTFNLTKRFGFDASLAYTLYSGNRGDYNSYYYTDEYGGNYNMITLCVGVHF